MNEATIALTIMTGLILLVFAGLLVWGFRSGQYRDVEAAKYIVLDDPDPRPADDQEEGSKP